MTQCSVCGVSSPRIAASLSVCGRCARDGSRGARELAEAAHARLRQRFGLPPSRPDAAEGPLCKLCANMCRPAEGELGLCGLRKTAAGRIRALAGTPRRAAVHWYHDPLPTNCCADWVCPGGSASGYPDFSYAEGAELGYENLAVFYYGCTFDCLFCQNWECRQGLSSGRLHSAQELAAAVGSTTSCICFFGGDPTPQTAHAMRAARLARATARGKGRNLRICWETNGAMNPGLLRSAADLSLQSGGCIKFDLKAHTEALHQALCGTSNRRTLENFAYLASRIRERPQIPLLIAATLLVPGYVNEEEVKALSHFIAGLDPGIPYVLLAFHPSFAMSDLPTTSWDDAQRCRDAALAAGLTRVRVGNLHLLGGRDPTST